MEYNSQRTKLIVPEYGRNIQKLVDHACTLKDRKERTEMAKAIVQVMGRLNPASKSSADIEQKLWDHLFVISDYKLDVDSPFDPPKPAAGKPTERMPYPSSGPKYKYYGKTIEQLIVAAAKMSAGDERDTLTGIIANMMKKSYLLWNSDSVNDELIVEHLREMSGGVLDLKPDFVFESTESILARNKIKADNSGAGKKKGRDRSGGRNRRRRK